VAHLNYTDTIVCFEMTTKSREMENHEYWQGVSSKSVAQRFERHASQTQDCIVEQRVEEKRKIAECIRGSWSHSNSAR